MKHHHKIDRLAKFLAYVLGRQPDEFGLVADAQGWVRLKDLLKALGEEAGWRNVRRNEIHELTLRPGVPIVEVDGERIRAVQRERLQGQTIAESWPKLLYHALRRRAYPVVIDKGVKAHPPLDRVVLALAPSMAERLGHRIDSEPVILTVNCQALLDTGAPLWRYGDHLYLTTGLPPASFNGPPVEKIMPKPKPDVPTAVPKPKTPGSYFVDLAEDSKSERSPGKAAKKRKNEWKRHRKKHGRSQMKSWPGE